MLSLLGKEYGIKQENKTSKEDKRESWNKEESEKNLIY